MWYKEIFTISMTCCFYALTAIENTENNSLSINTQTLKSQSYETIENLAKQKIKTPGMAERQTAKLRLHNGLEAIIISDPHAEKSSAAILVKAGSWQDPNEYPGIAHFLEHMLFLGTKKYPEESSFDRYLSSYGGMSNAFTASDFTAYLFTVSNDAFPEALDRFSDFFKNPLFNPSGVARELKAIDQEYAKNIENDDMRLSYVLRELGNPQHPQSHFNMGNSTTLQSVAQETLIKWWKEHYSANLMKLIITSPLPLDKIEDLVVSDFQGITSSNLKPYSTSLAPLPDSLKDKVIYIEPIKSERTLTLLFTLPDSFDRNALVDSKKIVCHLLGHEGEESLLADLKRENLAESLQCGVIRLSHTQEQVYIDIDLTEEGLKKFTDVIARIYQAINSFKANPIPNYIYDELQSLALLSYEFQERQEPFEEAMRQIMQLADEDTSTFPERMQLFQKFQPQAVSQLLDYLQPNNAITIILAPNKETNVQLDHKEKWLGASYAVKSLPPEIIKQWENVNSYPDIRLPQENPFIPKDLSIKAQTNADHAVKPIKGNDITPTPITLIDSERGKIYFAADEHYLVPQVFLYFEIKTPEIINGDSSKIVLGDLYVKSLQEALVKYAYPAQMAGLNYKITRTDNGIRVEINGYNDKVKLLLAAILKAINELIPTENDFQVYKEIFIRKYQNAGKEIPIKMASEFFKSIFYKNFSTFEEKEAALRKITWQDFEAFLHRVFVQNYIEGVFYGNIDEKQAKQFVDIISDNLKGKNYLKEDQLKKQVIVLPNNGPFFLEEKISSPGIAVLLAIECGNMTFKNKGAQQILMKGMRDAFFDTLRTKQQTGYLVYSSGEEIEGQLIDLFAVQSNTHVGRDLLDRFELFIESFLQEITTQDFTEDRFNSIKRSLIAELEQPPRDVQEMGNILEALAFTYYGDFNRRAKRIEAIKALTYDEFVNEARQCLGKKNKRRLAIIAEGELPPEHLFDYQPLNSRLQIKEASTFEEYQIPSQ